MVKRKDPEYAEIYRRAALVVPDGVPLLWAARFLGTPLQERINGTDLMEKICSNWRREKEICLFSCCGTHRCRARRNLQQRFPGLIVSGIYAPHLR